MPIVLQFIGSERLPTGELAMVLECKTEAEFFCMPSGFRGGGWLFEKTRLDTERGVAIYVGHRRAEHAAID